MPGLGMALVIRRSSGPLPSASFQKMLFAPALVDLYQTLFPSGVQWGATFMPSKVSRVQRVAGEIVQPNIVPNRVQRRGGHRVRALGLP